MGLSHGKCTPGSVPQSYYVDFVTINYFYDLATGPTGHERKAVRLLSYILQYIFDPLFYTYHFFPSSAASIPIKAFSSTYSEYTIIA